MFLFHILHISWLVSSPRFHIFFPSNVVWEICCNQINVSFVQTCDHMKWAIVRKAPFHRQKRMHRFRNGKTYQAQYPNALNDSSLIINPPHTLPAFSLTQRMKAYKILGESAILNISHDLAHTTFRASFRPQALQRREGTFDGGGTVGKMPGNPHFTRTLRLPIS